jgi:hypothetical protein
MLTELMKAESLLTKLVNIVATTLHGSKKYVFHYILFNDIMLKIGQIKVVEKSEFCILYHISIILCTMSCF